MVKLCVFDFDSTLMDGETISFIARAVNKEAKVSAITKRAMSGELDFYESLVKRVKLVEGVKLSEVEKITSNLPFVLGAGEIVSYLKAKGVRVVVFSGGFHIATDIAQAKLGFDANFANELHQKNGTLTGNVGGEMMFGDSKGKMLARLKSLLKLEKSEIAAIGDGANDVSMFKEAGFGIAFCANQILKNVATHLVETKDLREIKQIL